MAVHHCVAAGFLDRQKHRIVGPEGPPEFDATQNDEKQSPDDEAGLNGRSALFRTKPSRRAARYCRRNSVAVVRLAGMPGHGTIGVKAWLALTLINIRFGPGRPTAAHDSVHDIAVPSLHSQLCGKLGGKLSAGVKPIALRIELWMPDVSSGYFRAYSAPIRVVAANVADRVASIPKSAIPAAIRTSIGATRANSAATLPADPIGVASDSGFCRLTPFLPIMDDLTRRARRCKLSEGWQDQRSHILRIPGSMTLRPRPHRPPEANIWGQWGSDCPGRSSKSSGNRLGR